MICGMIRARVLALTVLGGLALGALNGCDREPRAADNGPIAKNGCLTCHAAENGTLFAPSFAAISQRYAGNSDAAALLAESLKNGSHGKWAESRGAVMPAQPQLSDAETKALVKSILEK